MMARFDLVFAAVAFSLVTPVTARGSDPPVVLTSSSRSIFAEVWIYDGAAEAGDAFVADSTTLEAWEASHSLEALLSGGSADCSTAHDSSTTPDGFTVALSCTAGSGNPGDLPESYSTAISSFSLEFTVVEKAIFVVDASLQGEFVSFDAYAQAWYQLEEVSGCDPGENCLVMDFNTCGHILELVPGTYRLTAGCSAFSQQFGVAGDTEVTGSTDLTFTRVDPTEFYVDPEQSLFAVDVFVPGVGVQHVETPAEGVVRAVFSECPEFGSCQMRLIDGDLQAADPQMTINTPIGDIVVSIDTVSLVESGATIGLLSGETCGYPDACCGIPSATFVHTAGAIGGVPYEQDLDLCGDLGACEVVILCGGGPCDCSTECPGVAAARLGPSLQLVLPGIEYTAEIDLGLGELNPSATFTGEIVADADSQPMPCAGDVDGSGVVDVEDLVDVILQWGSADAAADINDDGVVDVEDLVLLILNWGACA